MNLLTFIGIATWRLDYGFRWQTKRAVALFIPSLAVACQAQNIMPPTNSLDYSSVFKLPDLNPQPMGDWTNITYSWDAPRGPYEIYIDHYKFYLSPTMKPWTGHLVGNTTNLFFTLYVGGTSAGFPGVSAVYKSGIESGIML